MESMKKAGELMIPLDEYPHVPYWFSLRQVMAVMEKSQVHHDTHGRQSPSRYVLVFDEAYKLLGITRRRDILRGLELHYLAQTGPEPSPVASGGKTDSQRPETSSEKLTEGIREQAERPVSDVMLPIQATVDYEDEVMKVISKMVGHNISMLPVLKEDRVVGVIRSVEVFHEIANLIL